MFNTNNKIILDVMLLRRRRCYSTEELLSPRFMAVDTYMIKGQSLKRLRVIFRGTGCSQPTCTMCALPDQGATEGLNRHYAYLTQAEMALASEPSCDILCFYNDGSFFAEAELGWDTAIELMGKARTYGAKYVMVESLPQFITSAKLRQARAVLGPVELMIGIGLQSASAFVRERLICSPVKEKTFLRAVHLCHEFGVHIKIYLILQPPFLSPQESVIDTMTSCVFLERLDVADITICPTRVMPHTYLDRLWRTGYYRPPTMRTVFNALLSARNVSDTVRIAMFNLASTDLKAVVPMGCHKCRAIYNDMLMEYAVTQMVKNPWYDCSCCRYSDNVYGSYIEALGAIESRDVVMNRAYNGTGVKIVHREYVNV